jgi:anti-sigma B factor antagonist
MDLTFTNGTHESWTILSVAGELDLHTSPQLQAAIAAALDGGATRLAIDAHGVPFMDSSSLGVIVASLKRTRDKGGELALVGLQESPRKVIALTGLDSVLPIVDEVADLPPV